MGISNWLKWISLNLLAAAVLYARFSDTYIGAAVNIHAQALGSRILPIRASQSCGHLRWGDYVLISKRVVLPDGVRPAAVHIVGGKIKSISHDIHQYGPGVLNFRNAVIMPGVIDTHTHLNEPGRENWEGIFTGTRAAAAGGVTTVMDMPLNSQPSTTTADRLLVKQKLAKKKAYVNVGYWGGLVPSNAADHDALQALVDAGAAGFKSFMCPSGISDFEHVSASDIQAALPFLKKAGIPFYVHAELVSDLPETEGNPRSYHTYMNTRPPKFEQDAILQLIELLDSSKDVPAAPGFVVHIAHLADAGALKMIKEAQARHPITVETCAHYLTFNDTMIQDGQTQYKCAPPIRDAANQEALIKAVSRYHIRLVSSDHSPAPPGMKQMDTGNFLKAWGGISGVQYLLPATWTALYQYQWQRQQIGGVSSGILMKITNLLSTQPAALSGLSDRKGKLVAGYDADLVIWEPETEADTSLAANQHKHKVSPYTDMPLQGRVVATIVNGHLVNLFARLSEPCGKPVAGTRSDGGSGNGLG